MKTFLFLLAFTLLSLHASSQDYRNLQSHTKWTKLVPKLDSVFFHTDEAIRIGENVLLYQQITGAWPKNIYIPAELSKEEQKLVVASQKDTDKSTIDNNATTTEIEYLSKLFNATQDVRYRDNALRGINYLLKAQYNNGGWPQFYPRATGYYVQITYNDNAMVRVLKLLRMVAQQQNPYTFINDSLAACAQKAFDKGINCILRTQIRQKGKLTVWCAQHDRNTLAPCKARAYELPSLSGQESVDIALLLMSIPYPSDAIKAAVIGAAEWFDKSRIKGLNKEYFINEDGKQDFRMTPCDSCPDLWARFYDLKTNQPFFCDRDGILHYDISEIGYERRNGYKWFNTDGNKVITQYKKWKKKWN